MNPQRIVTVLELIFHLYIEIFIFRHAVHVSIDDEVLVNENDILVPTKVLNVSNTIMEGDYYYYYCHYDKSIKYIHCTINFSTHNRCLCPSNNGRQYCCWWSICILLPNCSSWPGSHYNDANQMVSWYSRVDLWWI